MASVRPAGATTFEAPQTITDTQTVTVLQSLLVREGGLTAPRVGIDAVGGAVVAWADANGGGKTLVAAAAPGRTFAVVERIDAGIGPPSLAVAEDGRALLAHGRTVIERVPGAERFERVQLPSQDRFSPDSWAIALGGAGEAVLAARAPTRCRRGCVPPAAGSGPSRKW